MNSKKGAARDAKSMVNDKTRKVEEKYVAFSLRRSFSVCVHLPFCNLV
jgi:hypothetical protein